MGFDILIEYQIHSRDDYYFNLPTHHYESIYNELVKKSLELDPKSVGPHLKRKIDHVKECLEFRERKKLELNTRQKLANTFKKIEENDTNYDKRYGLVFKAVYQANKIGMKAGIRIDKSDLEWPVLSIETPKGQVAWHMPVHKVDFDGHSTKEKYERCNEYAKSVVN